MEGADALAGGQAVGQLFIKDGNVHEDSSLDRGGRSTTAARAPASGPRGSGQPGPGGRINPASAPVPWRRPGGQPTGPEQFRKDAPARAGVDGQEDQGEPAEESGLSPARRQGGRGRQDGRGVEGDRADVDPPQGVPGQAGQRARAPGQASQAAGMKPPGENVSGCLRDQPHPPPAVSGHLAEQALQARPGEVANPDPRREEAAQAGPVDPVVELHVLAGVERLVERARPARRPTGGRRPPRSWRARTARRTSR